MVGVVVRCRWSWPIVGVGLDQECEFSSRKGTRKIPISIYIMVSMRRKLDKEQKAEDNGSD